MTSTEDLSEGADVPTIRLEEGIGSHVGLNGSSTKLMFENDKTGGFGALMRGGLAIEVDGRSLNAPVSHPWKAACIFPRLPPAPKPQSPVLEIDAESDEQRNQARELTRGSI